MNKMCTYETKGNGGSRLHHYSRAVECTDKELGYKRTRVTCPECGRRMIGWATISHDGELIHYAVPPHKVKKWWKKKK